ncbi:MAG: tetratricopeptide repeat protein [Candidatus Riflebacteria bacterium]|nr:tetratricopeptide repeat protein [Candidatus Riflebacteria bacterium]
MACLRRLFAITLIAASTFVCTGSVMASRKATDIMADALRARAAGNLHEAISSFEYALENTTSPLQKNLARFMLGDCQIEAGLHKDAVTTFNELLDTVSNPEEQAEAVYRLMQAESALGNKSRVASLFSRMRRNHKSSPYFELGQAFMKSEGLRVEADENSDDKQAVVVAQKRPAEIPKSIAEPVSTKQEPVAKLTASEKPVPERPKTAASVPPPVAKVAQPVTSAAKLDGETARLLRSILTIATAEDAEKEELATRILSLQDSLKDGLARPGMDKILLELAESTAKFGELLEACKTYDQVLTNHPASPLVEKAYYEAIRLRAVLGVHEAVIGWSKAFLAAFPTSEYRSQVRAMVEYSRAGGKLDLGSAPRGGTDSARSKSIAAPGLSSETANAALNASSEYIAASNKMKEGRYNLALVDFKRLSGKHQEAPQIWWDLSLVNVQLEDFRSAEKAIKQMLKLDPDNQDASSLLGYIHYRLENYEEAATAYDNAGEPEGRGVNFFDAKTASQRMKKTAGKIRAD